MANEIEVEVGVEVRKATEALNKLTKKFDEVGKRSSKSVKKVDNSLAVFKGNIQAIAASAAFNKIVSGVKAITREFIEFEKALVGVGKTTGITGRELEKLGQDVQELSKRLPVAATELLRISQTAGQLGVRGTKNILNFTETIAKLGATTDLSGEEGATALIRILNASGETVDNIDELASVVVRLGNNFAATESEITRVATEVARSTAQFRIGSQNVVAIATALKAVGVQAQLGGSVIGKAFRDIDKALRQGGVGLQELEKITGKTGAQLAETFGKDKTAVLTAFVSGLGRINKAGGSVAGALERFGLKGDEVNKVLPVLATNTSLFTSALTQANDELINTTALEEESAAAFNTLDASVIRLKNNLKNLAVDGFSLVAPAVKDAVDGVNRLIGETESSVDKLARLQGNLAQIRGTSFEGTSEGKLRVDLLTAQISETEKLVKAEKALADQRKRSADSDLEKFAFLPGATETGQLTAPGEDPAAGDGGDIDPAQSAEVKKRLAINAELDRIAAERALIKEEKEIQGREVEGTRTEEDLTRLQEIEQQKATIAIDAEIQKTQTIADEETRRLKLKELNAKKELTIVKTKNKQEADLEKQKTALAQRSATANANIAVAGANLIAAVATSGSKEVFLIQKAAAIAQSIVSTNVAAAQALAAPPGPPLTIPLAAQTKIIGALNTATIAATAIKGFQDGGIVGGTSFSGDRVAARVNSGEMILNRQQQASLFELANTGGSNETAQLLRELISATREGATVNINGRPIARAVKNEIENGFKL